MKRVTFETVAHHFVFDGALVDLIVANCGIAEWDAALEDLRLSGRSCHYSVDDVQLPLPIRFVEAFQARLEHSPLLAISVGGILLHIHFFSDTEVEMDLDPREVNKGNFDELQEFISNLARVCGREVWLTPECCDHTRSLAFLIASPTGDVFGE